jgi:hypothetical protein
VSRRFLSLLFMSVFFAASIVKAAENPLVILRINSNGETIIFNNKVGLFSLVAAVISVPIISYWFMPKFCNFCGDLQQSLCEILFRTKLRVIKNAPNKAEIELVCSDTNKCSPHVQCIITNKYIIAFNGFREHLGLKRYNLSKKPKKCSFKWQYKSERYVRYYLCDNGQYSQDDSDWRELPVREQEELKEILKPTKCIFYYKDPRFHERKKKLEKWSDCENLKKIYSMEHTKIISRPEPERTRWQWEVGYQSDFPEDASIIPLSLFDSHDSAYDFIMRGLAHYNYPEQGYTVMLGNGAKRDEQLKWERAFDKFNVGKNLRCTEGSTMVVTQLKNKKNEYVQEN